MLGIVSEGWWPDFPQMGPTDQLSPSPSGESPDAIEKAIAAVRAYYEKIGFNPGAATAEWGVISEVGQYHVLDHIAPAHR